MTGINTTSGKVIRMGRKARMPGSVSKELVEEIHKIYDEIALEYVKKEGTVRNMPSLSELVEEILKLGLVAWKEQHKKKGQEQTKKETSTKTQEEVMDEVLRDM